MKIPTVALLVFDAAILGYVLQQIISWHSFGNEKQGASALVAATPHCSRK
jgi:hypothetical protein